MSSIVEGIFNTVGVPALLKYFGIPAVHTSLSDVETDISVIYSSNIGFAGTYGDKAEDIHTIECVSGIAHVGEKFTIDDIGWRITQIISNDGIMTKFAVREINCD